jgi:excisionase family DNA binding protein
MIQQHDLGVAQVARRWGYMLGHVYNLVRAGKLEAEKQGTQWRIPLCAVEMREKQRELTARG